MRSVNRVRALAAVVLIAPLVALAGTAGASANPSPGHQPARNSWHVASVLGLGLESTAVSCTRADGPWCLAVEAGTLLSSADWGVSWDDVTDQVPAGISALQDVSCAPTGDCYLTALDSDSAPVVLRWSAGSLERLPSPGADPLPSIVCVSNRQCMATDGTSVFVTRDAGQSWAAHRLDQIVYTTPALTCVDGFARCLVVGDRGEDPLIEVSTDGGRSWASRAAPATTDGLYDVSCPIRRVCFAVGANVADDAIVIGSHDYGTTWQLLATPHHDYALRSISCPTRLACWATGQSPAETPFLLTTADSGASWTDQNLGNAPSGGSPYISCPTGSACVAVSGGRTYTTSDGGESWLPVEVPAALPAPQGLSCPTRKTCVGVGNDALGRPVAMTSADAGVTWVGTSLPDVTGNLWDLDCPDAQTCFAVASGAPGRPGAVISHALVSHDGGSTWTFGRFDDRRGVLGKISCPSPTTCLAGGYGDRSNIWLRATTDGGQTWTDVASPPGAFDLDGLDCTSPTSCVLVTDAGSGPQTAWTTSDLGQSYEPHSMPGDADYYFDVGCAETTCLAVGSSSGDGAMARSLDGGLTWTTVRLPLRVQLLYKVVCTSATVCAATAQDFSQGGGPLIVGTTDGADTLRVHRIPTRLQSPSDLSCLATSCWASDFSPTGNPIMLAGRV